MNALVADPGIASQILAEHRAGLADAQCALRHARRAGELLLEARERCGDKGWLRWLSAHCPEIPERTAQRYMQIARHPEIEADSVREAILKLAAPRKPGKPAREPNNPPRVAGPAEPASTPPPAPDPVPADAEQPEAPETLTAEEVAALDERAHHDYVASLERAVGTGTQAELDRLNGLVTQIAKSRDYYMDAEADRIRQIKAEQRKVERLERRVLDLEAQVERLESENEALKERIGIMEEST